jgi:hypothetical protein
MLKDTYYSVSLPDLVTTVFDGCIQLCQKSLALVAASNAVTLPINVRTATMNNAVVTGWLEALSKAALCKEKTRKFTTGTTPVWAKPRFDEWCAKADAVR